MHWIQHNILISQRVLTDWCFITSKKLKPFVVFVARLSARPVQEESVICRTAVKPFALIMATSTEIALSAHLIV